MRSAGFKSDHVKKWRPLAFSFAFGCVPSLRNGSVFRHRHFGSHRFFYTLFVLPLFVLSFGVAAQVQLDVSEAKKIVERHQENVGRPLVVGTVSVELLSIERGVSIYRVHAEFHPSGEQTYQIRLPFQTSDGVSDFVWTTHWSSQVDLASSLSLSLGELAAYVQMASEAGLGAVKNEMPELPITGVFAFMVGEDHRKPRELVLMIQIFYKEMDFPLLRTIHIHRDTKRIRVSY